MALSRPALQSLVRFPRVAMNSADLPEIFRPPVNRSMRVLDRNFFQKTLPIAAATVFDDQNLSSVRNELQISGNLLGVFSIKAVVPDETVSGRKCVLLQPGVLATGVLMLYICFLLDCF
jgi:tRNA (guanine37-N1)-methyltransferase